MKYEAIRRYCSEYSVRKMCLVHCVEKSEDVMRYHMHRKLREKTMLRHSKNLRRKKEKKELHI